MTLGGVALEALRAIEYHQYTLRSDAARIHDWNGRCLVPLYHPSSNAAASHERLAGSKVLGAAIEKVF